MNAEQTLEESKQNKQNESKGEICINFHCDNNRHTLTYSENGIGMPKELDFRNTKTFGLQIVNSLTQQIYGSIELGRSKGTEFKIIFEL